VFKFLRKLWSNVFNKTSEPKLPEEELEIEFLRHTFYDEVLDAEITVELVCTCGLPVVKAGEDGFYCMHCDRPCPHGLMACAQCGYAMLDRDIDLSGESAGEEG
jgi:hypothetical protein